MKTTFNREVKAAELQLGDIVRLIDGPFGTAIVKKVEEDSVTFFRPYGTNHDFAYTDGVICLTGVEEFSAPRSTSQTFFVYERQELR